MQSNRSSTPTLRKISTATGSLHDENTMKASIADLYQNEKFTTSNESLLSTIDRFLKSVNTMSHVVMVPSKLVDIESDEEDLSSNASSDGSDKSVNLHDSFKMLVDAKDDLVWRTDVVRLPDHDMTREQFKYHLDCLNSIMHHFSDVAEQLTKKYQNETGLE